MRVGLTGPEVLSDDAAIAAFEPDWRAFTADHATSPFDSPRWLRAWYRHYAGDSSPRLLVWRHDGRVVGVAPFVIRSAGRLVRRREASLWASFGPAIRGLADVVASDDHREAVFDGLVDWLAGQRQPWDVLHLLRLPPDSVVPARLREASLRNGWRMVNLTGVVRSTTYVIDLPADEQGRPGFLGSKARHNLRTEANRFARSGGRFEQVADPAAAAEAVAAIRGLMTRRWGGRELDFAPDPVFEPFLVDALGALLTDGSLQLDIARDDSGIRAGLATMTLNRRAVALLIGVSQDEDVRRMSLGKQLFKRSIEAAIRGGCRTYDLLWAGGYKESFWHATPRTMESFVVGRGLRGRPVAEVAWFRRRVLPSIARRRGAAG
jgi:CelD/BcsL family acetyltransferase involved in cellulose biosynthesis